MDRVHVMQLVRAFQVGQLDVTQFLAQVRGLLRDPGQAEFLAEQARRSPVKHPRPVLAAAELEGSELVSIREQDNLRGYLAPAPGASIGVVVIQEWWGLNDHIKQIADRFAEAGMLAVAPDLYHGVVTTEPDEARKAVMELDMDQAVQEVQAAADYLLHHDGIQDAAVVGFCMGGRLTLRMSAEGKRLGAAVAFYGRPLDSDQAAQVKVPILGLYGSEDRGIPVESVHAMQRQIEATGIPNEFHIYQGAGHAFFNDTRASYHPEAAKDAWSRTQDWIRSHATPPN
jgi:carboxymethylenebutenolidase